MAERDHEERGASEQIATLNNDLDNMTRECQRLNTELQQRTTEKANLEHSIREYVQRLAEFQRVSEYIKKEKLKKGTTQ